MIGRLVLCMCVVSALLEVRVALAQSYPARTIRIIVPFSPGGASDTGARIIGQQLTERWGQQVIVENRPGAGGTIGTGIAAKAAPDGYTLLYGSSTELAVNPHLYPKLTYDTLRDFAPVALVSATPLLLVVHPSLPVRSTKELVVLAKGRPGEILYASSGNGATTHLGPEMFKQQAGINMKHIPYKGSAPAVVSVISGETQVAMMALPAVLPHVEAGRLRALGASGPKRAVAARQVPTLIEAGYPRMEIVIWNGVVVPSGTPQELVTKLTREMLSILSVASVQKNFRAQGAELTPADARAFGAYIKSELARFAIIVKQSGARID